MAVNFLTNREVSDLCLGKPPLKWVPAGASVSEALSALKRSGDSHVSVWSCSSDHSSSSSKSSSGFDDHNFVGNQSSDCQCVGKICVVDVICFLCKEENLADPFKALEAPVSEVLPKSHPLFVKHLEPNSSLLEAIDYILDGVQNLVIPIESYTTRNSRKKVNKPLSFTHHNGREYCWLTEEDVVRFILNSIGVFSPIPTYTIESLNMIDRNIMAVHYNEAASSVLPLILRAHVEQTSVAVIDENKLLVGEISPSTLALCDETVAAAITTLSAGDLLAYIDCCGPPEELVQLVKMRLAEKNLEGLLDLLEEYSVSSPSASSSCSSDDESVGSRYSGSGRYSFARRSEAIVCHPWSSLVAVMIQALAHRVSCVWVIGEDQTVVGNVTFQSMLKVFRGVSSVLPCKMEHANSSIQ
ncbi:OLC1v1021566C1 [Oldenlandia corymbosa var. corymbosa]|uniref:OLC1v1021566C1 n=1 Tax=Oldenlandia corymbosa var. corymbosa TaxID=529605 RepID=A0AAV1BVZ4_OLDCO|nr:OLC1v1021566C1 [Oldenlandia corymbosa var. corymbosa]